MIGFWNLALTIYEAFLGVVSPAGTQLTAQDGTTILTAQDGTTILTNR